MKNVRQKPKSLAATGDVPVAGSSQDDTVFDKLMNMDVDQDEVDLFSVS